MKKYSKRIVTLVILLNVAFAIAVLYLFYYTGNEPTTLIQFWFGFTTVELWSLAGIKKREIRKDEVEIVALNEMFAQTNNEDLRGD